MLFTSIFITSAIFAAPIPLPQGPGFGQLGGAGGAGGIIGARAVTNTFNGAQSSYAAQQAALNQISQSAWAFQNPNAAFGGNSGTWDNTQPNPTPPKALF